MRYYSNGKLLITGEYLVLDGATSLALPTKKGQDLEINILADSLLVWSSFDENKNCWFEAIFELPKLRLISTSYESKENGSEEKIAETLQAILQQARTLNPSFLHSKTGFQVKTHLSFPRFWGLGTSSTLINNIASWAQVDAFQLLWSSFSGSGYDIACAQHNKPILYKTNEGNPRIQEVIFDPSFRDQLFFIYLNKKQNSRQGIKHYKNKRGSIQSQIKRITEISNSMIKTSRLFEFEDLLREHEAIISNILELPKVKEHLFPDYFGEIKSLGAWGGDFILATGNEETLDYFSTKGYKTVLPYTDMIL